MRHTKTDSPRDHLMSDPKMLFSRRQMGGLFTGLAGASLLPASAFAQSKYLDIRRGSNFQPVPIAVTNFAGDQGPALSGIITNNFARTWRCDCRSVHASGCAACRHRPWRGTVRAPTCMRLTAYAHAAVPAARCLQRVVTRLCLHSGEQRVHR